MVCIESFLSIGWRTFICWKKSAKGMHCSGLDCVMLEFFTLEPYPKNNCFLPCIFEARFGGKDRGLCTYKPWSEQAGGLEAFLYLAAQNFELQYLQKLITQIKKSEIYSGWYPFRGLSNGTTLIQIQSGQTVHLIFQMINSFFPSRVLASQSIRPLVSLANWMREDQE